MAELTEQSLKETFAAQQQQKTDIVLAQAQRLVNMYRHADSFGPEFADRLDEALLAADPEVQMALPNIQGGQIVRRYYDFLKEKNPGAVRTADPIQVADVPPTGYLPSPDEDLPLPRGGSAGDDSGWNVRQLEEVLKTMMASHRDELDAILKSQAESLSGLMNRLDRNTHEVATSQTDRLINALQEKPVKQKYEDVIETPNQTPAPVSDDLKGF